MSSTISAPGQPILTPATRPALGVGVGVAASIGLGAGAAKLFGETTRGKLGLFGSVAALSLGGSLMGVYGNQRTMNAVKIGLPVAGAIAGAAISIVPMLRSGTSAGHAIGSLFMLPVTTGLGALAGYGAAMGVTLVGMGAFGIAGRHSKHA